MGLPQHMDAVPWATPLASAYVVPHPTRPNEDTFCICPLWLGALGGASFFGVYDGHSGSEVSRFLAASLHHYVEACGASAPDMATALSQAFQAADSALEAATINCPHAGSTATVALLGATEIVVAHCGDSRALLCRGGQVIALTEDHRPARQDERERVLGSGGQILWNEGERVMGVLATTRAFGDRDLKQFGVTADPEVTTSARSQDDDFLILATDGVFNVLSNDEVADIAHRIVKRALERGSNRAAAIRMAASAIGRFSRDRNSKDDITVVVVDLATPAGSGLVAVQQPAAADVVASMAPAQHHASLHNAPVPVPPAGFLPGCAPTQQQPLGASSVVPSGPHAAGAVLEPQQPRVQLQHLYPACNPCCSVLPTGSCVPTHMYDVPGAPSASVLQPGTQPELGCNLRDAGRAGGIGQGAPSQPDASTAGTTWTALQPACTAASPAVHLSYGASMVDERVVSAPPPHLTGASATPARPPNEPTYAQQHPKQAPTWAPVVLPADWRAAAHISTTKVLKAVGDSVGPSQQSCTASSPPPARVARVAQHSAQTGGEDGGWGPSTGAASAAPNMVAGLYSAGLMLPPVAGGLALGLYRSSSVVAMVAGAHAGAVESG